MKNHFYIFYYMITIYLCRWKW